MDCFSDVMHLSYFTSTARYSVHFEDLSIFDLVCDILHVLKVTCLKTIRYLKMLPDAF